MRYEDIIIESTPFVIGPSEQDEAATRIVELPAPCCEALSIALTVTARSFEVTTALHSEKTSRIVIELVTSGVSRK